MSVGAHHNSVYDRGNNLEVTGAHTVYVIFCSDMSVELYFEEL